MNVHDLILIVAILLVVVIAASALMLFRQDGAFVTVSIDGKVFGEYSLHEDRVVERKSGDGHNTLVIDGGKAYVSDASCPDGICSSHRPISYDGQSIICLPNKVVVEISAARGNTPDVVA